MINIHHLVYAIVLLVFLTGAALVAVASFLSLCTGLTTVAVVRVVNRVSGSGLLRQPWEHPEGALAAPVPIKELFRQPNTAL